MFQIISSFQFKMKYLVVCVEHPCHLFVLKCYLHVVVLRKVSLRLDTHLKRG